MIFEDISCLDGDIGSRQPGDSTRGSEASGLGSTPGYDTPVLDTGYHPFEVGEMCRNYGKQLVTAVEDYGLYPKLFNCYSV